MVEYLVTLLIGVLFGALAGEAYDLIQKRRLRRYRSGGLISTGTRVAIYEGESVTQFQYCLDGGDKRWPPRLLGSPATTYTGEADGCVMPKPHRPDESEGGAAALVQCIGQTHYGPIDLNENVAHTDCVITPRSGREHPSGPPS